MFNNHFVQDFLLSSALLWVPHSHLKNLPFSQFSNLAGMIEKLRVPNMNVNYYDKETMGRLQQSLLGCVSYDFSSPNYNSQNSKP